MSRRRTPPKDWPAMLARLWGPAKNTTVDLERSAEHWFLDAATYAHDGDREQAVEAALRGIEAIRGRSYAG